MSSSVVTGGGSVDRMFINELFIIQHPCGQGRYAPSHADYCLDFFAFGQRLLYLFHKNIFADENHRIGLIGLVFDLTGDKTEVHGNGHGADLLQSVVGLDEFGTVVKKNNGMIAFFYTQGLQSVGKAIDPIV